MLTLREVTGRADLRTFIHLPEKVHANHANWLPPMYSDEWDYFNPAKNNNFAVCDTLLLLAYRDDKPVGRVMGIVHHPHNEKFGIRQVRFSHLEAYDDAEAVHALLEAVETWGKSKGMTEMIGPYGFSNRDPEGMMIEGFDEVPVIITPCNLPYLPLMLEKEGFVKKTDCFDYLIDIRNGIPDFYPRIYERIRRNTGFTLLEFTSTKQLKPFIIPVFELINITYKDIFGFMPLDRQEMDDTAKRFLPLLDPRFVKAVLNEQGRMIAFIVGMPNLAEGIQKARGRLWPFGLWHILRAAKKTKYIDLLLGGIEEEYRGRGLDILMGWKMIESARAAGFDWFETHLVLESNTRMRAEYEKMGARMHKKFRIYEKNI